MRGPAGGMFACLLLAAALGGVAAANPGVWSIADDVDAGDGVAVAAAAKHPDGAPGPDEGGADGSVDDTPNVSHAGREPGASGVHTLADCAAAFAPASADLPPAAEATGTASAIYTLLSHCETNLSAPGSLNSLHHVVQSFVGGHGHGNSGGNGGGSTGNHGNGTGSGNSNAHGGNNNAGGGNDNAHGGNDNAGGGAGATPGGAHGPSGGQSGGDRPQTAGGAPPQTSGGGSEPDQGGDSPDDGHGQGTGDHGSEPGQHGQSKNH